MITTQKNYAVDRVRSVLKNKLEKLTISCTKKLPLPSKANMLRAIKNDSVRMKRNVSLETPLKDAFDFTSISSEGKFDSVEYHKAAAVLREEAAKICDEIVLGDEEEALKLIRKYCGEAK